MNDDVVIKLEHVGKKFRLKHGSSRTLKSVVIDRIRRRDSAVKREFWALKDVCFEVKRGETLGIIGANGAGKSTLLSLISGAMKATEGSIRTNGTVSSLLELGGGFHPELTGRENVFLYGAIMGLSRKQMTDRFKVIVDFAELGKWIDEPVRHYSSGMYLRLGFAVAVEVDPEILLVDEVLAVGDTAFQSKCVARMREFRDRKKTMLIISHDLPTIVAVSDRILFLENGCVHGIGTPSGMVENYREFVRKKQAEGAKRLWGTQEAVIDGVAVHNSRGEVAESLRSGEPVTVRLHYTAKRRIDHPVFGFAISDTSGHVIYGNNTQIEAYDVQKIEGSGEVVLRIDRLSVSKGTYALSFSIHSQDHHTNYCRLDNNMLIRVEAEKSFEGCYMPCRWSLT